MHGAFDSPSDALIVLDGIRRYCVEAVDLEQIKNYRDQAEAIRHYLRAAIDLDMQNKAAEVKLLVERRLGQLLKNLHLHGGDRKSENRHENGTLGKLGITRIQSARWQREASLPEGEFQEYLRQTCQDGRELTSAGLLRAAQIYCKKAEADGPSGRCLGKLKRRLMDLACQGLQFACVYADPPWPAQRRVGVNTKSFARELSELPILPMLARQAHLHLWTSPEQLEEAMRLLRAWGFHYRSSLVRTKLPKQFSCHWQPSHDMLLLGVRGQLEFRDCSLPSWLDGRLFDSASSVHEIQSLIERVSHPPYLHVFGHSVAPGWTVVEL